MPAVRSVLNPASARGSVSFDSAVEQTAKKSVDWHAKVTNTTHSRSAKGALMSNTSGLRMPVLVTGAVLIAVVAFSLGLACNLLQDAPLAKVRLSGTEAGQAGHWLPASGPPGGGYYLHNSITDFFKIAKQAGTDKVTSHTYEDAYSKYFELMPRRGSVQRLFEIGLGCTMEYGPGASSKMWRQFLPQAEIWQAEYNSGCVESHRAKLKELGVKVVTGDQSDTDTLKRWISETGGRFDVIIDDGGHSNMQQYNSFLVLFEHALKPGGVYFIEDLQGARTFVDGDKKHIMIEVIKDWIEGLVMQPEDWVKEGQVERYTPKFGLPPGIKFIDCANSICAITKCYEHDKRCVSPHTDPSLTKYSSKGTASIGPGK